MLDVVRRSTLLGGVAARDVEAAQAGIGRRNDGFRRARIVIAPDVYPVSAYALLHQRGRHRRGAPGRQVGIVHRLLPVFMALNGKNAVSGAPCRRHAVDRPRIGFATTIREQVSGAGRKDDGRFPLVVARIMRLSGR